VPETTKHFMKKMIIKKILLASLGVFALLTVVLAVHIYVVTRPKAPATSTRIMARIDIKQAISQAEATRITAWLYQQKGVDHVLCNPGTAIAVFTFSPLKANANDITGNFKNELKYPKATRYIPTEKELQGGCPVASSSFAFKAFQFFKNKF
jgi:hypothetical protein